eukprot:3790909-Lingulodinium_polyedra.AAC.1
MTTASGIGSSVKVALTLLTRGTSGLSRISLTRHCVQPRSRVHYAWGLTLTAAGLTATMCGTNALPAMVIYLAKLPRLERYSKAIVVD